MRMNGQGKREMGKQRKRYKQRRNNTILGVQKVLNNCFEFSWWDRILKYGRSFFYSDSVVMQEQDLARVGLKFELHVKMHLYFNKVATKLKVLHSFKTKCHNSNIQLYKKVHHIPLLLIFFRLNSDAHFIPGITLHLFK